MPIQQHPHTEANLEPSYIQTCSCLVAEVAGVRSCAEPSEEQQVQACKQAGSLKEVLEGYLVYLALCQQEAQQQAAQASHHQRCGACDTAVDLHRHLSVSHKRGMLLCLSDADRA